MRKDTIVLKKVQLSKVDLLQLCTLLLEQFTKVILLLHMIQ